MILARGCVVVPWLLVLALVVTGCVGDPEVMAVDTTSTGPDDGPPSSSSTTQGPDVDTTAGLPETATSTTEAADTDTTGTDTTGTEPGCGNGVVELGEDCDDLELAGATCESLGFGVGTLACDAACAYDTSNCPSLPAAPVLQLDLSQIKQLDFTWVAVAEAEHYQLLESAAPGDPFVQIGGDILGESISFTMPLHLRHGASYVLRACNDTGCSESAPVSATGSLAAAVGYFKASNTDADDHFGGTVALSGDGTTLVVGAVHEGSNATGIGGDQTDDSALDAGAVYVFVRDAMGQWSQQAYVKAANTSAGDELGGSLALSHDGDLLVVGAPYEDGSAVGIDGNALDDSAPDAGAVYVFMRDAMDQWSQQAYIKASNTDANDRFGRSVALSGDGRTLAVGANLEDGNATGVGGDQTNDSVIDSGAVYVFVRDAMDQWSQAAYVKASNTDDGDLYGTAVALSSDGDTLVVGAPYERSNATGIGGDQLSDAYFWAGAVYVLARDAMGQWSQAAYVKASNTDEADAFGQDVALSGSGDVLAVGAAREDSGATGIDGDQADDSVDESGAVYVFVRDAMGAWSQGAYVKASNTDEDDLFGADVALDDAGDVLAISAVWEASNAAGLEGNQADDSLPVAGAVYVFVRDAVGAWSQRAYVKAIAPDELDGFGVDIALTSTGDTLAVGASLEDGDATGVGGDPFDNMAEQAGAVYLY